MKTNATRRESSGHGIETHLSSLPFKSSRQSLAVALGALAACLTLGTSSLFAQEPEVQMMPIAAPNVGDAYPSQDCLWSPNHKFVPITISGVTIAPGNSVGMLIFRVTSDEPNACITGSGGTNHAPDATIACDGQSVDLRAERSGDGNGRVYRVKFVAWNASINPILALFTIRLGAVEVSVPHDQKDKECCPAVDDGQCFVIDRLLNPWTDADKD